MDGTGDAGIAGQARSHGAQFSARQRSLEGLGDLPQDLGQTPILRLYAVSVGAGDSLR